MKLIERYIFRRTLNLTLASLGLVTFIVLTTQSLLYLNIVTQSGQSLATFLKLALTLIPTMLLVVMPFALLLGATSTLNRLNTDSELAVLEAAGAGKSILVRPILLIAVAATAISLFISFHAEPWSSALRRDLRVAASADLLGIAVQSGSFREVTPGLYIQIAEQHAGGTLAGIFLVDRREDEVEMIYYARSGRIARENGRNLIIMSGGEIHRRDIDSGDVSIISFHSYAVDMAQFGPDGGSTSYHPRDWPTAELLDPDPNNDYARKRPDEIRAEIHDRFTAWLYPLPFALLPIVFAGNARANRDERVWGVIFVFAAAFLLRGAGFVAASGAGRSALDAVACYALPLGSTAVLALLLRRGKVLVAPQALVERSNEILERVLGLWERLQLRFARRSGGSA